MVNNLICECIDMHCKTAGYSVRESNPFGTDWVVGKKRFFHPEIFRKSRLLYKSLVLKTKLSHMPEDAQVKIETDSAYTDRLGRCGFGTS